MRLLPRASVALPPGETAHASDWMLILKVQELCCCTAEHPGGQGELKSEALLAGQSALRTLPQTARGLRGTPLYSPPLLLPAQPHFGIVPQQNPILLLSSSPLHLASSSASQHFPCSSCGHYRHEKEVNTLGEKPHRLRGHFVTRRNPRMSYLQQMTALQESAKSRKLRLTSNERAYFSVWPSIIRAISFSFPSDSPRLVQC